jgi:hypothetical protein
LKTLVSTVTLGALAGFMMLGNACGDPVHDDLVSALGAENPKVPVGPLHRPGQPCMACHGGRGPAKSQFSMAGTVFTLPDKTDPLAGVVVNLKDSAAYPDGKGFNATTNTAGNFFLHSDEYVPAYPVHVSLSHPNAPPNSGRTMFSHVGRDGSCAGCHHDPVGTESPGHIYFADDATGLPPSQ